MRLASRSLKEAFTSTCEGSFIPAWTNEVNSFGLEIVDISRGLGLVLAVKDDIEQVYM